MRKKVIIILSVLLFNIPFCVNAITLGEYEAKLSQYKNEVAAAEAAANKAEAQIKSAKATIENIKKEMLNMADEISKMEKETDEYDEEIKNKNIQTKELYQYLQVSNGKDLYLEYALGSETISDFIYRMSIVEQLSAHNDKVVKELEDLIEANKKREKDIEKRKKELDTKESNLYITIENLGQDKTEYMENGISANKQVSMYQELVDSYKAQGCKSDDIIGVDCAVTNDAGLFKRPTTVGYVTQWFGYSGSYLHRGVDISSANRTSEKIYPIANGTITAKYVDGWGALVIIMEHYSSAKKSWYTSMYGHFSSFAPNLYVGKKVTSNDYLGYMGNSGYSFGVHLHLEVVPCRLNDFSDKNCKNWASYTNYVSVLAKNNYKGPAAVISFPSSLRKTWYSR